MSTARRWAVTLATPALKVAATRRLHKALQNGPTKLVLGAGSRDLNGWLQTDVTPRARLYMDATKPWPVPGGALTHVYADNVIEHVPRAGARAMLGEAHKALKRGGRLRVATPDVATVARIYVDGDTEDLLAYYKKLKRDVEQPVDVLNVVFHDWGHSHGHLYDQPALTALLVDAGFNDVTRVQVGESDDPTLRGLEKRTGGDAVHQLVLEAVR